METNPIMMLGSINHDEYTCILYNDVTDMTCFCDAATGEKLFENLPPSIVVDSVDTLKQSISDLTDCSASVAEEGTTIRVFYNKRWYTATKRKLQAFRSNWADKSTTFGATFAQAVRNEINAVEDQRPDQEFLEAFYEQYLCRDKVYFFVLRNTAGERIVCRPPIHAKALHIGTQVKGENDFQDRIALEMGAFTHTTTVSPTYDAIRETLSTLDYKHHQGVIVAKGREFYKIILPDYARLAAVRGITASLRMCYLKLRHPKCQDDRLLFLDLYPEFATSVEELETQIFYICCRLHKLYMEKYINRSTIEPMAPESRALQIIHSKYLASKIPTTASRVNDVLSGHPIVLNHLLKEDARASKWLLRSERANV